MKATESGKRYQPEVPFAPALPSHWEVRRLKYVSEYLASNVDKKVVDGERPVRLCNYTDVYYNDVVDGSLSLMSASATDAEIQRFTLRAGDVIITKDSETAYDIAASAFVPADMPGVLCGYHLGIIRSGALVDGSFMKRLFDSVYIRSAMSMRANGLTRVGLSQSAVMNLNLPLPPVPEQRAIAAFLDAETAKIDALIEEQRRLIELLKEKRQAVISHAVTKGLNPDAPMKPSGVEWLGDVPAHWEVRKLGPLATKIGSGKTPRGGADTYVESGILFLRSQNIHVGGLRLEDIVYISSETDVEMATSRVILGDILLNITGASLGRSCLVRQLPGPSNVNQHVCIIRLAAAELCEFISLAIVSIAVQSQIKYAQNGAAREGLNYGQIANLSVAIPTEAHERNEITDILRSKIDETDTLVEISTHAIALLQERRSALISAAVTGKIDVRDYKPDAAN